MAYQGYTKQRGKTTLQYLKKNTEQITLMLVKNSEHNRNYYKEKAKKANLCMRQFILQAMNEKIERDNL